MSPTAVVTSTHAPQHRTTAACTHRPSVLLVTAQPLLTHALSLCFSRESQGSPTTSPLVSMVLAGAARTVDEAFEIMRTRNDAVQIMVLDLDLVRDTAADSIRAILAECPRLRILTLSGGDDLELAVTALRAGACGYLSKEAECNDFVQALHCCLDSDLVVEARTMRALAARALGREPAGLSANTAAKYGLDSHEVAVLNHLAQGRNNQEMAMALFVSLGSVKAYLAGASKKLGARDRVQLLVRAYELGLATPHLAEVDSSPQTPVDHLH